MAKVLGVGGVFFKAEDPRALGEWYQRWLGIEIDPSYGSGIFYPKDMPGTSFTVWGPFRSSTTYFEPSDKPYMINLIVDDLREALVQVENGGANLVGTPEEHEYGLFAWFIDPEGNKVELWQPK